MIRLLNNGKKTYKFNLSKNPVTRPMQSPMPTGIDMNDLDPDKDRAQIEKILKHEHYSLMTEITIVPGINEIRSDEHAEYIYSILGSPEEGGVTILGSGKTREVTNSNFLLEVDKEGNEVRDNFFSKYRNPVGMVIHTEADPSLFKLMPEESK